MRYFEKCTLRPHGIHDLDFSSLPRPYFTALCDELVLHRPFRQMCWFKLWFCCKYKWEFEHRERMKKQCEVSEKCNVVVSGLSTALLYGLYLSWTDLVRHNKASGVLKGLKRLFPAYILYTKVLWNPSKGLQQYIAVVKNLMRWAVRFLAIFCNAAIITPYRDDQMNYCYIELLHLFQGMCGPGYTSCLPPLQINDGKCPELLLL